MKKTLGLIGFPLTHSFSKKYFAQKFEKEGISDFEYIHFPLQSIDELPDLIRNQPDLLGLNVTLPYKKLVFKYLNDIDEEALHIGAVNTIKIMDGILKGYNTDIHGLFHALTNTLKQKKERLDRALVLGTGGASAAVVYVLHKLGIAYRTVSRSIEKGDLRYAELNSSDISGNTLIINTTPLGTFPNVASKPHLPYQFLSEKNVLFDLVYNPSETAFLKEGKKANCIIANGLEMLYLQANKSWEIWIT